MATSTEVRQPRTDKHTIELALHECASANGSAAQAARNLAEKGVTIPERTIRYWQRDLHADRYAEIREEVVPKIHAEIAAIYEDQAREAATLALEAARKNRDQLDNIDDPQVVSTIGRNAAVSAGIATTHLLPLRDRPSVIIEHRDADALFRKLRSVAPTSVVDSTAQDITNDPNAQPLPTTPSRTLIPSSAEDNAPDEAGDDSST